MFSRNYFYTNINNYLILFFIDITDEKDEPPSGLTYWIPNVDDEFKIVVGSVYATIDMAEAAYMKYAEEGGFDVRRSNKRKNKYGEVQNRFLLCSKEGVSVNKNFDTMGMSSGDKKIRNSNIKRIGCKACVKFRLDKCGKQYVVYKFEDKHNHPLYNADDKKLSRAKRKMQYIDYRNLYHSSSANIGASKSHMIQAAGRGGYEYMGATSVDYQNARRDMQSFVGTKDAQMLVNLLEKRRSKVPDYFFDYIVRERELQAIF